MPMETNYDDFMPRKSADDLEHNEEDDKVIEAPKKLLAPKPPPVLNTAPVVVKQTSRPADLLPPSSASRNTISAP